MSDDPFAAPEAGIDNAVRTRTANTLYKAGAGAVGTGLFALFCCNPFFIGTILTVGSSLNALRLPSQYEISMDEDYPSEAGMLSRVGGAIGLLLAALQVVAFVANIGLQLTQ